MELEQARKRAEELRVIIERNNRLYYDHDAPELDTRFPLYKDSQIR